MLSFMQPSRFGAKGLVNSTHEMSMGWNLIFFPVMNCKENFDTLSRFWESGHLIGRDETDFGGSPKDLHGLPERPVVMG